MSFQSMMDDLKKDYVASIPEKIAEIKSLQNAKDLPALREAFHKLKGSGRTYGLAAVSEVAAPVEWLFKTGSQRALPACSTALILFERIYVAETKKQPFVLEQDPEFLTLTGFTGKLAA